MKIEIDTDELVEFYKEEWKVDISFASDLKEFLAAFCKKKIEGKEEPAEEETVLDGGGSQTDSGVLRNGEERYALRSDKGAEGYPQESVALGLCSGKSWS